MALSTKELIARSTLETLAQERLEDSALLRSARFACSIYIGVYAVECLLKACICKTLDLDALPGAFKEHDLEILLKFSGLEKRLQAEIEIFESFKKLSSLWNPSDESKSIRYIHDIIKYDKKAAEDVNAWLNDTKRGVVPWLRNYLK